MILPVWLLSPIARKIGMGILVIILLLGLRAKFIADGKRQGREDAGRELIESNEKERQAEREVMLAKVAEADKAREEAQARYEAALARESEMAATVRDLARRRQDAGQAVTRIPDAGLHSVITDSLALRPKGDATPGYFAIEERELARCLADRPLCQQQADALGAQVGELHQQVTALSDKQRATDAKVEAFATYTVQLESHYTALWNAFPKKRNWPLSIVTFGLLGKPKRLPTPDPADLRRISPIKVDNP